MGVPARIRAPAPAAAAPPRGSTKSAGPPARPVTLTGGLAALRGILDRPLASYFLLLSSAGLLLVIGLTMVFSATSVQSYGATGNAFALIAKQAVFAVIGLLAFWLCQRLPARTFRAIAIPLLALALGLLFILDVLLLLKASKVLPAAKIGPFQARLLWLYVGPIQLQPSELGKLALVVWGADVITRKGPALAWWRELATPLFPMLGLLFLLVGYNDLGTMLCLLLLVVGLLWAAGVRLRFFAVMAASGLSGVALLILAKSSYRAERLTSFLNPSSCDASNACYQVMQGRYAIADGGWFGVGLGESSLKWDWLPNAHNDFIFAVIAEELGVIGCMVVLALFAVLAYTGLRIARRVADPFRRLAAAGIVTWLIGQAVINIGGVVGLVPITGVPLPFISDGGSALVVTMAAIGMLASFARAEPEAARALHARPPARWVRLLWAPLPPMPADPRSAGDARPASAASGRPAPGRPARPAKGTGKAAGRAAKGTGSERSR
jgi:cell division protein FtsW